MFLIAVLLLSGCQSSNEIVIDEKDNLTQQTNRINKFDESLKQEVSKIKNAIKKHDLISLSAPQIGIKKQIMIVNENVFINPSIIKSEGQQKKIVRNISVPGIVGLVNRSKKITISYQDLSGKKIEKTFNNNDALEMQLNIDILNGVLFYQLAEELWSE